MIERRREQTHEAIVLVAPEGAPRIPSPARARAGQPTPKSPPTIAASESICASWLVCEPSGEPSSKNPRKYHSPSQQDASTALCHFRRARPPSRGDSRLPLFHHFAERLRVPRTETSPAKHSRRALARRRRFMPSFQSPLPNKGNRCAPRLPRFIESAAAVFPQRRPFAAKYRG